VQRVNLWDWLLTGFAAAVGVCAVLLMPAEWRRSDIFWLIAMCAIGLPLVLKPWLFWFAVRRWVRDPARREAQERLDAALQAGDKEALFQAYQDLTMAKLQFCEREKARAARKPMPRDLTPI
jgi:hypothetical protein